MCVCWGESQRRRRGEERERGTFGVTETVRHDGKSGAVWRGQGLQEVEVKVEEEEEKEEEGEKGDDGRISGANSVIFHVVWSE